MQLILICSGRNGRICCRYLSKSEKKNVKSKTKLFLATLFEE
jgi:hypothetical protein